MDTYFAIAERTKDEELASEIALVSESPVISGLLHSVSGLLAILDEHRQIVALNDSFLKMIGIDKPSEVLGLRPGEAINCIHANEAPAGCGTTQFCSTCGAAISIVSSLGKDKPVERICALTVRKRDQTVDIALLVRSQPIRVEGKRFLLLFLQDITLQQQRAALERIFFHDVNNMLCALAGATELLSINSNNTDYVKTVQQAATRLKKEVAIQRSLLQSDSYTYKPLWHETDTRQVIKDLQSFFTTHPAAANKKLSFIQPERSRTLKTDISLLSRILCNMVTNALEASENDHVVKIWTEEIGEYISFCVWNRKPIPSDVRHRIFQRNFSTKEGAGRGVGTYSMKLFGEQILGGEVIFASSLEAGTVFKFSLPV